MLTQDRTRKESVGLYGPYAPLLGQASVGVPQELLSMTGEMNLVTIGQTFQHLEHLGRDSPEQDE